MANTAMSSRAKVGIQYGWLSKRIFIGRINKAQNAFLDGQEDHTESSVWAVAEYVSTVCDGEMELTNPLSGKRFRISVEDVRDHTPSRNASTP